MAQYPTSGYASYVNYGYEATYGTAVAGTRTFGHGVKITHTRKNNLERIYGLGDRNFSAKATKQFEGTASVEFVMSNASFLRAVLGDVTDGGSGPYTHSYAETNRIPSFTICAGTELGTDDEVVTLKGCKVNTATITAVVNEVAKVRLECLYQNETLATSGIGSQVLEVESPFVFSEGAVKIGGSTIGNVQSIELTINNSLESLFGLGSRFKTAEVEKQREYNVRMTIAFSDVSVLLEKFFGNSSGPATNDVASAGTLDLTFNNGLSSTDEREIAFSFATLFFDTETLPKSVTDVLKEDVEGFANTCSVVWTNNTSVDDGSP